MSSNPAWIAAHPLFELSSIAATRADCQENTQLPQTAAGWTTTISRSIDRSDHDSIEVY